MSLRRCVQGIAVAVLLAIAPCAAALAQPVITPSGSAFGLAPPPGYAAAADLTRHASWERYLTGRTPGRLVLLTTRATTSPRVRCARSGA